eukprot:m.608435 g.608435  ORF g.608435 m.608435 type:complete len:633 (-) comp22486_c0_seq3:1402-3300(-)
MVPVETISARKIFYKGVVSSIRLLIFTIIFSIHLCSSTAFNSTCYLGTLPCGASASGTTAGSSCSDAGSTASPEILYNFSLAADSGNSDGISLVTFDTCGSSFDTVVRIYNSRGIEFSFCDDCGPCGLQAAATILLVAGNYTLLIEGYGTEQGSFRISTSCGVPSNDGAISCGQTITGSTISASDRLGNPSNERIYSVVVPNNRTQVTFDSCASSLDTFLHLYNNPMTQQLTYCDDCGPCGLKSVLSTVVSAGIYNLVVEGYRFQEGSFSVTMRCSEPEDPSAAYQGPIECGQVVVGDTADGAHTTGNEGREHHYSFVVAPNVTNRNITFSTCGSQFDTYVRILNADSTYQIAGCDDCGGCGYNAVLQTQLDAGSYVVVVEGYHDFEGQYSLQMACGSNASNFQTPDVGRVYPPVRQRTHAGTLTGYVFAGILMLFVTVGMMAGCRQKVRARREYLHHMQQGNNRPDYQNNHHADNADSDAEDQEPGVRADIPPAYTEALASPNYADVVRTSNENDDVAVEDTPQTRERSPSAAGDYMEVGPVAPSPSSFVPTVDTSTVEDDCCTDITLPESPVRGVWTAPTPDYRPVDEPPDGSANGGDDTSLAPPDAPPPYTTLFLGDGNADADNAESSL